MTPTVVGALKTYAWRPDGSFAVGHAIEGPLVIDGDTGRVLSRSDAEAAVHKLAQDVQARAGTTYGAALTEVARSEPELARVYAGASQTVTHASAREAAGRRLDELARSYSVKRCVSYAAAFEAITADPEHGDLVATYVGRQPVATRGKPDGTPATELGAAEARGAYGDPLPKITADEFHAWVWRLAEAVLARGEAKDHGTARKIVLGDPKNKVLRAVHRRLLPYDDLPEPPEPEQAWT